MRNFALAATLILTPTSVYAEPLNVVASFSILADMVREVGGEHVTVTSLVGPGEDAHVYAPVPNDVVAVANADLVVVNGLGFEGFLDRLVEASGTQAPIIIASRDVNAIATEEDDHGHDDHDEHAHDDHGHDEHAHDDHGHDEHAHDDHGHDEHAHDDHGHNDDAHDEHGHSAEAHDNHDHGPLDPHAWQSLEAARDYVATIAAELCAVSAENCDVFTENARVYDQQLIELRNEIESAFSTIPQAERIIITSHDAFAYLAREFDLELLAAQGLSTDSEASAAEVAALIDQIRDSGAHALFVETVSDPRLITQIADETGLTVSGTLYSDALSDVDGPAGSYLAMMRYNAEAIVAALSGS